MAAELPNSADPANSRPPVEIENKFRLDDPDSIRCKLAALGAQFQSEELQIDEYFNHPTRDFRATDEALRVRQSDAGLHLTYKGPRTDDSVKIREEIELPLGTLRDPRSVGTLLQRLGFRSVARVQKFRETYSLQRDRFALSVSIDRVEPLGWFAEVELIVTPAEVELGTQYVLRVQRELGLSQPIRESYLRMVLAQAVHQ